LQKMGSCSSFSYTPYYHPFNVRRQALDKDWGDGLATP
jgi:hypothetical protein